MKAALFRSAALLAFLALGGCGQSPVPDPGRPAPEVTEKRLAASTPVDVAAWLAEPREKLAKLADEQQKASLGRLAAVRDGKAEAELLPTLRVTVQAPVFRAAAYRAAAGFSLPAYIKDGPDAEAALHLARHGDQEAALKLADAASRPRVEALKLEKNYPVEWTRLVGLTLADAQLRLAAGDADAAATLVRVHEQLGKLFGPTARSSSLASVLLGQGQRALQMAALAWRTPAHNKPGLADDVEKALKAWGEVPPARLPLRARAGVAHGADLERFADLLGLPVPSEGLLAGAAFADADGRLAGVQLAYRSGIATLYPRTADLGVFLAERGMPGAEPRKSATLSRQEFNGPGLTAEVVRTDRTPLLGAIVTLAVPGVKPADQAGDPRAFGPLHLSLPFSAGRDALSPVKVSVPLEVTEAALLTRLTAGLDVPAPAAASVGRASDADLIAEMSLSWPREMPTDDAGRLLAGLWAARGKAAVLALDEKAGGGLILQWQSANTRASFLAPYSGTGASLTVVDTRPEKELPARLAEAKGRAAKERQARIAAGKPDARLLGGPEAINGLAADGLRVGKTKGEAEAALARMPDGKEYKHAKLADGVSVTTLTQPSPGAESWARQVLVRYEGDKVAEVRVRYQEGLAKVKPGAGLAEAMSADPRLGPGETVPPTWAGLWADIDTGKTEMRRWRDDLIERTYQRDAAGSEVAWRARPEDGPARPWRFLAAGAGGVALGDARAKVVAAWGEPAAKGEEPEVFRMPAASPYEQALVWWDKGTVARLVLVEKGKAEPAGAMAAVQRVWGRDVGGLGYIRRQTGERGPVLGSLFWHDDAVRVQVFAQKDGPAARVMTEWRPFHLGVKKGG